MANSGVFNLENTLDGVELKIYRRLLGVFRHSNVPSPDGRNTIIGVIDCKNNDLNVLVSRLDDRLNKDGICLRARARRSILRQLANRMQESGELEYKPGSWSIPALAEQEEASRKRKPKGTKRKEKRNPRLNPLPA